MIDPHVHLRDFNGKDKETVLHGILVAKEAGFQAVFDMPNTSPAITSKEVLLKRLEIAKQACEKVKGISYHLYLGLTQDEEQIKEMVSLYNEFFPTVVGLKLFAGQSTGNMGIVDTEAQHAVFKTLAFSKYKGVVALHAEKESELKKDLYIPGNTPSHSLARPESAEIESVKDILRISKEEGFCGHLHFCHISTKGAVDILKEEMEGNNNISFGVTPHHALFNIESAKDESRYLKMNPPLRCEESRVAVMDALLDGSASFVESDHAPHLLSDKENGASGIPGFKGMVLLYKTLKDKGVSYERLQALFGGNVQTVFGLEKKDIIFPTNLDEQLRVLSFAYPFDPFF